MTGRFRTGESGLNLIKGYEGLRMTAHYAPTEEWTVGYGHTTTARHGMSVTEGDAERLLKDDLSPMEALLQETVRAPLNQNEHDALISLVFNIGEENFRKSTVLRKLNQGDKLGAAKAFEMWTRAHVNGELVTLDGLVRRRAAEKSLFLMPTDASLVIPSADIRPAAECETGIVSAKGDKPRALVEFNELRQDEASLSPEEKAGRVRALFSATQAIAGDPTKMIISKAEEREDFGVTIGAALAGLMAIALTVLGVGLMLGLRWPDLAAGVGLHEQRVAMIFENMPVWLAGSGAMMSYFILYILAKRASRHEMKIKRAREMARVRTADV